jgi:hypothetical protein
MGGGGSGSSSGMVMVVVMVVVAAEVVVVVVMVVMVVVVLVTIANIGNTIHYLAKRWPRHVPIKAAVVVRKKAIKNLFSSLPFSLFKRASKPKLTIFSN